MQINVRNRAKPAPAAPYAEQPAKPRRKVQGLAMIFIGLAGYWASFFQGEQAEAAAAPDPGRTTDAAAALLADPPATFASEAVASAEDSAPHRAPPSTAQAADPGHAAAATQHSATPEPLARTAIGAAPAVATGAVETAPVHAIRSAASPANGPAPADPEMAEAEDLLPPAPPQTDAYSITDLLADLLENTDSLGTAFKANLLELAMDDWLSAQALHRLLNGTPDPSLAGFTAQEEAYAELLRTPGQRDAVIDSLLRQPSATPSVEADDLALSGGTTTLMADAAQPLI